MKLDHTIDALISLESAVINLGGDVTQAAMTTFGAGPSNGLHQKMLCTLCNFFKRA